MIISVRNVTTSEGKNTFTFGLAANEEDEAESLYFTLIRIFITLSQICTECHSTHISCLICCTRVNTIWIRVCLSPAPPLSVHGILIEKWIRSYGNKENIFRPSLACAMNCIYDGWQFKRLIFHVRKVKFRRPTVK